MRVILGHTNYSFHESIVGKKVIARKLGDKFVEVRVSELLRVGATLDLSFWDADEFISFSLSDFEFALKPTGNCTENNVGEGWEGWYEQAPVRKSKFR